MVNKVRRGKWEVGRPVRRQWQEFRHKMTMAQAKAISEDREKWNGLEKNLGGI